MAESLYGGAVTLYEPTAARAHFRLRYTDTTGKARFTTGGATRAGALERAAELVGIATPAHTRDPNSAPTVKEAFGTWMAARQHKISPRTFEQDRATIKRMHPIHDVQINRLTPTMAARLDTNGRARDYQKRVRSLLRQMLTMHRSWLTLSPDEIAAGVHVDGARRDDDRTQVDGRGIPTAAYVHALMAHLWSTENPALAPTTSGTNAFAYTDDEFSGVPAEMVTARMRAVQRHYSDPETYLNAERQRVGRQYQTAALVSALAAGALMRWGEIAALRLHHVMDDRALRTLMQPRSNHEDFDSLYTAVNGAFSGHISVEEQASNDAQGRMIVGRPKNARARTTTLPSFLPAIDHNRRLHAPDGREARTYTQREAVTAWRTQGTPALRMMMVTHLAHIITAWRKRDPEDLTLDILRQTMLFPASKKAYKLPTVTDGLRGDYGPDPLTNAGYLSNGNFRRLFTPVMDYISAKIGEYPATPSSRSTRSGYTLHALRHYGISVQLRSGRSVVDVSADAGHRTPAFTLQRYSHLLRDAHAPWEF